MDDDKEEEYKTIEVRGYHVGTSDDTLECYFENPRKGGGEIVDFQRNDQAGVVYITFADVEVAKNVAEKSHKIGKCVLEVKLYIPPPPLPSYKDRLLITGLKDTTTKDCLINFLEVRGQCDIQDSNVVYGDKEGAAVVIFEEMPDLEKLQEACVKRPLEGSKLTISKVPVSNIITVRGLKPTTNKDTVCDYFEGKRSGNVDGVAVEKVHMKSEEGCCLVYFKDHAVIKQILYVSKGHKLEGSTLDVSTFYECLNPEETDCDQTSPEMPSPLEVKNVNRHKLHFIKECKAATKRLLSELKLCHAELSWSDSDDSSVNLTCTLTAEVQGNILLSQTWAADAESVLKTYLTSLEVEEIEVLRDTWDDVVKKLDTRHTDDASMFLFEDLSSIVVVGYATVIKKVANKVKSLVRNVQEAYDKKKQEISETVSNVTSIQLRLLLASDFQNQMMSKYPGLSVDFNLQTVQISFQGCFRDVMKSQVEMFNLLQTTKQSTLTSLNKNQVQLVDKKGVRDYIVNKLKNKGLVGVWEVADGKVTVLAFSDSDAADIAQMIEKSVNENKQTLYPEAVTLLSSGKWDKFTTELSNRYGDVLKIIHEAGSSCVTITATDDVIAVILQEVDDFISSNAIFTHKIKFPSGVQHFLQRFCHDHISQITSDLKSLQVQIEYTSTGDEFTINAPKHGIDSLVKALKDLATMVEKKEYVHKRPGIHKVIKSQRGCQFIRSLESSEMCIIQTEFDSNWKITVGNLNKKPSLSQGDVNRVCLTLTSSKTRDVSNGGIAKPQMSLSQALDSELSKFAGESSKTQQSSRKTRFFNKPSMATARFGDSVTESYDSIAVDSSVIDVDSLSTISLFYFSNKLSHIDQCIQLVETFCEEEMTEKILEDELLKILNPSQIKRVKSLENDYQVKVTLQQDIGRLRIQGLQQDVSNASDVVQILLRDVDHFEQECKKAEILSNIVQWYFIDTETRGQETNTQGQEIAMEYDKDVNGTIEKAHYDGYPTVTLQAGTSKYIIDFNAMEEYVDHDRSDSVKVVRKDLIKGDQSKTNILEVESAHFEEVKMCVVEQLIKQQIETSVLPSGKIQIKYQDLTTYREQAIHGGRIQKLNRKKIKLKGVTINDQKIRSVMKDLQDSTPEVFCAHIPEHQIIVMFGEDRNKLETAKQKIQFDLGQVNPRTRANRTFSSNARTVDSGQQAEIKKTALKLSNSVAIDPLVRGKLLDVMVYRGDITTLSVDAIVNAANGQLAHGAGVARAIASAAGDELVREGNTYVREHGSIPVSGVVATTAGQLPYKKVLHAVGPEKYKSTDFTECLEVLCKTILRCLCESRNLNMSSVAIPSFSSGIFGVPKLSCAQMYMRAVKSFDTVVTGGSLKEVHFVDISDDMLQLIQQEFVNEWDKRLIDDVLNRDKKFINQCLDDGDVPISPVLTRSDTRTAQHSASTTYASAANGRGSGQSTSSADVGVQIIVDNKDIFSVDCQAIICWKDPGFTVGDHPIAQKIFYKAGEKYKKQLNDIKKQYSSHFRGGLVFVTDCENMHQPLVIHGVIHRTSPTVTDFKNIIPKIVSKVHQKNLPSVVIPVFRCLTSDSVKIFTETLCQAVKVFSKKNPHSTLKQIHVVDIDQKVVDRVLEIVKKSGVNGDMSRNSGINGDTSRNSGVRGDTSTWEVDRYKEPLSQSSPYQFHSVMGATAADNCAICMDTMTNPVKLKKCGHTFCKECIENQFKNYKPICPNCGTLYGVLTGDTSRNSGVRGDTSTWEVDRYKEPLSQSSPYQFHSVEGATAADNCAICMDTMTNPVKLKKCGHTFCKECIENQFKNYKPICPNCGTLYGVLTGDTSRNSGVRGDTSTWEVDRYKEPLSQSSPYQFHSVMGATAADNCAICMDTMTNPVKLKKCGHTFCKECIENQFKNYKPICPNCGTLYGVLTGDTSRNSGVRGDTSTWEVDQYKEPLSQSSPYQFHSVEGATADDNCVICMDTMTDPVKLNKCSHMFCKECIENQFKNYKPICPNCGTLYMLTGNMPTGGKMNVSYLKYHLSGYEKFNCICIEYSFQSGRQMKDHPNEGERYTGITRTAYLPDSPEGRTVLAMLRVAWDRRLTFTIGRSVTTGQEGVITWNDIHHKTNILGGPNKFGYPDPGYLARVTAELADKGITEESIKDPKYKNLTGSFY